MPVFDTPEPIAVTLEFEIGTARISASKRADTVVEVRPANGADDADVRAAQQTEVTYVNGRLTVKGPRKRSPFGRPGSLEVSVELPSGSQVQGTSPLGDFLCEGPLGDCRLRTSAGDIRVEEAATVTLKTSHGDIHLGRATGDAEIIGSGRVEAGRLGGAATVKNGNGETTIDETVGHLKALASNGRITVGLAHTSVDARSANGAIRIDEIVSGRITLATSSGDLEVGVRESTAAWLDVKTGIGAVHNHLTPSDSPEGAAETVEVRARTSMGDITIRRP
ncbi:DUF4097 family beta strand repeat-containing protein [Streptomyces hesseae]|uniref:DUF4097 family beta strand repeat-containing protein n=1 Tax=Streptomyces hesseae TaxID=3075519 RepID=A0ABU2SKK5_9ACTN|nr:DUF4097 family beta strand repeat-containing protein [Streptomyces sp. DSM 40473]MDT0449517.1 DUF4097 family beta strand repeat-containing protein [Streptomyces sp. DSM 40473]